MTSAYLVALHKVAPYQLYTFSIILLKFQINCYSRNFHISYPRLKSVSGCTRTRLHFVMFDPYDCNASVGKWGGGSKMGRGLKRQSQVLTFFYVFVNHIFLV